MGVVDGTAVVAKLAFKPQVVFKRDADRHTGDETRVHIEIKGPKPGDRGGGVGMAAESHIAGNITV